MNTETIVNVLVILLTAGVPVYIYLSDRRTKAREKAAETEYRKFSAAFERITELEKTSAVEKTHRRYIQKDIEELKK